MTILDRYILREFMKNFFMIIISLIALYLIVDFFERVRMFLSNHATVYQMLSYFCFTVPSILSQMLPVALLLGTLITFAILSKNSEVTAMKANGVSLYRLTIPFILFSCIICIASFLLNEFLTPYANQRAKHIKLVEVQKRKQLGSFKQNEIWYKGRDGIYNFSLFDAERGVLKGIRINYLDRSMNLTKRIDAREARWRDGTWQFRDLLITTFPAGDFPVVERVQSRAIDLAEKPSDFMIAQKDTSEMGFFELRNYIRKIQSEGYDATQYLADMHGKFAFSLVNIILAILGISFSIRSERSGGVARSIGLGIVIGFSYWLLFAFSISLGRSGTLPPLLAAWTANMILGVLAVVMFLRVKT